MKNRVRPILGATYFVLGATYFGATYFEALPHTGSFLGAVGCGVRGVLDS